MNLIILFRAAMGRLSCFRTRNAAIFSYATTPVRLTLLQGGLSAGRTRATRARLRARWIINPVSGRPECSWSADPECAWRSLTHPVFLAHVA